MAGILTALDTVQKAIHAWDKIHERIRDQKATEALAIDLSEFGLESRRVALLTNFENLEKVIRDQSAPVDRKEDLDIQGRRVCKLLEDIGPAIDEVFRNYKRGRLLKLLHTTPNRELAKKVEAYRVAFRDFDQAVLRADRATSHDSWLLIKPSEMRLIGPQSSSETVSDGISVDRVSYTTPGARHSKTIRVLRESLASSHETWEEDDESMRALARGLSGAVPHWHIPKLIGYERNMKSHTMRLVFEHPDPDMSLVSLTNVYAAAESPPSLDLRVRLCYQLALAVSQAHKPRVNVVHKHIRPSNLLLAVPKSWKGENGDVSIPPNWGISSSSDDDNGKGCSGIESQAAVAIYLCGWQDARTTFQASFQVGETDPWRVVYQHPERHQLRLTSQDHHASPVEKYSVGHDIYSLGVCMMELLTWDVLVRAELSTGRVTLSDAYQMAFGRSKTSASSSDMGVGIDEYVDTNDLAELLTRDADKVKRTLVRVAETSVPPRAGGRLASLVCQCLACLDSAQTHGEGETSQSSDALLDEVLSDLNAVLGALEGSGTATRSA